MKTKQITIPNNLLYTSLLQTGEKQFIARKYSFQHSSIRHHLTKEQRTHSLNESISFLYTFNVYFPYFGMKVFCHVMYTVNMYRECFKYTHTSIHQLVLYLFSFTCNLKINVFSCFKLKKRGEGKETIKRELRT